MSVVLGLITPRYIVLASDSQENIGQQKVLNSKKLFRTSHGICGFVGDSEAQWELERLLNNNPDPKAIVNWPTVDWGAFYFTLDGRGYEIDSPGEIGWIEGRHVIACGTGDQYAVGAVGGFCAARNIPDISRCSLKMLTRIAHIGVSAAINWDRNCGGEIQTLYLTL